MVCICIQQPEPESTTFHCSYSCKSLVFLYQLCNSWDWDLCSFYFASQLGLRVDGERLWTADSQSYLIWTYWATLTHESFRSEPFHCSSGWMFRLVVLLEGEFLAVCSFEQVFFQDRSIFSSIIFPSDQLPRPCWGKAFLQHDVATSMFHGWDAVVRLMCSVTIPPTSVLHLGQQVQLWSHVPEDLLPHVCCVSDIANGTSYSSISTVVFFWPLIVA